MRSPDLPPLPGRQRSSQPLDLQPLDSWHAPPPRPPLVPAGGLYRRGGALACREDSLRHTGATSPKGGDRAAYRRAVTATIWSFVATAAFALFVLLPWRGRADTLDFVTGFLVEKSLSVDNLFVFLMLFEYFRVPNQHAERVLRWGIMSALVLRGAMIAVGVVAVQRFRPVLLLFAAILIVSAWKMLQPEAEEEELSENFVMRLARRIVPATDEYDGDRFFTRVRGRVRATPLLVVLVCVELSDILFAVDSVPAVISITHDPLIVYTSNIFALLALRSLYMLLSRSVQQLRYLRHAVATILEVSNFWLNVGLGHFDFW